MAERRSVFEWLWYHYAVQRAAFGKSREQCCQALLHPLEDMQERLISSLKALRVSKAIFAHERRGETTPVVCDADVKS